MREVGLVDAPSSIVNASSGEELGSWELSQRMEKMYGQPVVAILWRDALRILSDALPDECKNFGYECVDISQVCFGIARPSHFHAKKAKKKGRKDIKEPPMICKLSSVFKMSA